MGETDGRKDKCMDGQRDGWKDEWNSESVKVAIYSEHTQNGCCPGHCK